MIVRHAERNAALVLLLLCLLAPFSARAQGEGEARRLLRRGVDYRKNHRDRDALEAFERSNELAPSPVAHAQIALAAQALSDWVRAEEHLRVALASTNDSWIARNRAELERSMAEVVSHLGWLVVSVNVTGAVVILDGKATVTGRSRVPVGRSVLQVRAPGHFPDIRAVDIAQGSEAQIDVALVPFASASLAEVEAVRDVPPPTVLAAHEVSTGAREPKTEPAAHPNRLGPVVIGSLGLTAIGVGAYFGARALGDRADRDRYCFAAGCLPQGIDAYRSERSDANVSTISIVAGSAAVASALIWFIFQNRAAKAPTSGPILIGRTLSIGGTTW